MKKRSTRCKTYGRNTEPLKQSIDFDKVFKNVADGNSTGNSPFSTSDSSAGRSVDQSLPTSRYNFRGNHAHAERDNLSGDILDESFGQDSLTTPRQTVLKRASQRDTNKGKQTRKLKEVKKTSTKQSKNIKADCTEKENTYDKNIPDYDAIAEDSFVVETENMVGITKCSTPVADFINSLDLRDDSGKMPTPIFHVLRSSKFIDANKDNSPTTKVTSSDEKIKCDDEPANVTLRRKSKRQNKMITRKILLDSDSVLDLHQTDSSLHNSSQCADISDQSESFLNSLKSMHERSSMLLSKFTIDDSNDSTDEPLKSLNLGDKKQSPSQDLLCPPPFNVSDDLFQSHKDSNADGLSCISEENEEFHSSLEENSSHLDHHPTSEDNKHLSESFYDKLITNSICESEKQTAEEKLMKICEQKNYISFSSCISPSMMSKCVKIGEGVYGEVFRSVSRDQNVAIKIIPIEGDFNVNDCPQKTFDEILPEAVIAKELSDLAHGPYNLNFCQVNRISCVQGSFPAFLLKQWDAYAQRKVSENDRPDIFPKDQLFAVFEFVDGGIALENFEISNHRQALSILRQVVFALAVAESSLEFEHRDLHIGNVLVRPCQETSIKFMIEDEETEFLTEGVFATIIDFTISRLKKDGCAVFCDVSTDDGLFEGSGDYQFDVYRDMRETNQNDWSKFCPFSNVLWIHYLCKKLATVIKIKDKGREYRNCQRRLRQLNECILNYESCFLMAFDNDLWDF